MQAEAKQLLILTAGANTTVDTTTTLITGYDKLFMNVRQSVGSEAEAFTTEITLRVRDFTQTQDGNTAWTTIIGTTDGDPINGAVATTSSTAAAVNEWSFGLSRSALKSAKRLEVSLNHDRDGVEGVTQISLVGLTPHAGTPADNVL